MNKILLAFIAMVPLYSLAQNTFPSSGNVGIGTANPILKFQVDISGTATNYGSVGGADISIFLKNNNTTAGNMNIISFGDASSYGIAHIGTIINHSNHSGKLFFATRPNGSSITQRLIIDENGYVGIGTSNPSMGRLQVNQSIDNSDNGVSVLNSTGVRAVRLWTDTNNSYLYSGVTGQASLILNNTGNVGIGTTTPQNKLDVNGTIHSKEVKVDLTGWPDYVFEKSYKLTPLSELKSYLDTNKHLPEIPSASEVEQHGLKLGEMNALLVKKIEELTLYLIQQQEQINALKEEIKSLKK